MPRARNELWRELGRDRDTVCGLRTYRPGDEPAVFALVKTVLSQYGLKTNPEETDRDIQDICKSYLENGGQFKVLERDGQIIGSYGIFRVSPAVCELRKMYLYEQFRGAGLGRMMMEDALDTAKVLGYQEMVLETNACLKEAIALYCAFGFEEFQADHLSDRCDMAMRKAL